jgi:hypothetical protein
MGVLVALAVSQGFGIASSVLQVLGDGSDTLIFDQLEGFEVGGCRIRRGVPGTTWPLPRSKSFRQA